MASQTNQKIQYKLPSKQQIQPEKPQKFVELISDNFGFWNKKNGENIQIQRFTWRNSNRIQVQAMTYGATVISIRYPNCKGVIEDVVLGFDDFTSYLENKEHNFGSTIGRHANYINNATYIQSKQEYKLTANLGKHHYNGGKTGFNQVVWNYHMCGNKVIMSYLSPDGEEGYPGDLIVTATFELTSSNEFRIEYKAMSTKSTIINIANHIYFNLAGHAAGDKELARHTLMLNADCHTVTGEDMLPTGDIQSVLNTDYDFQTPKILGPLLEKVDGYNNNFCINRGTDQGLNFIGRLMHPCSGRILEIYSNQYGVQFDTANTFPNKCEPETTVQQKSAKCPYLKAGVTTFDMLDEIHNKIVEIKFGDPMNDYEDLINLLQDMMKKQATVHRDSNTQGNAGVKRSVLTLQNLPAFQLTNLQMKYCERILKSLNIYEENEFLEPVKSVLNDVLHYNKLLHEAYAAHEKRKAEEQGRILRGKRGSRYCKHGACALQSQNYPDAINQAKFPSPVLKPGQTYSHVVVYKFWVKSDQSGITGFIQL